jgi:hypothetical protein
MRYNGLRFLLTVAVQDQVVARNLDVQRVSIGDRFDSRDIFVQEHRIYIAERTGRYGRRTRLRQRTSDKHDAGTEEQQPGTMRHNIPTSN